MAEENIKNKPEIMGPGAHEIHQTIADATGFSGGESAVLLQEAQNETEPDPEFPFGHPNNIDWTKIDSAGIQLIKEINLRPWMKSTEYCSGHPLDRPSDEKSEFYPYITGNDVYEEIGKLDMAYIRGLIPDVFFRRRKQELRERGATRFYLNVNVYNIAIFQQWTRMLSTLIIMSTNSILDPLIVRYNPVRPGMNYTIHWDYWTLAERELIHQLAFDSLMHFPV